MRRLVYVNGRRVRWPRKFRPEVGVTYHVAMSYRPSRRHRLLVLLGLRKRTYWQEVMRDKPIWTWRG